MRLGLICVGRLKTGPERELYARYADRIAALRRIGLDGLDLREIDESKAKTPVGRMVREAQEMLALVPSETPGVDPCGSWLEVRRALTRLCGTVRRPFSLSVR